MKVVNFIIYNIFSIMILLVVTYLLATTPYFYNYEFKKNKTIETTGLTSQELQKSIKKFNNYLSDKEKNLNFEVNLLDDNKKIYNQKEIEHMHDVKEIFMKIKVITSIYFIVTIGNYIHMDLKNNSKEYLLNLFKYGFYNSLSIVILVGILCIFNFETSFLYFHRIFFDNDKWLLSNDDMLILQLPEVFFKDAAILIIFLTLFINATLYFLLKRTINKHL